MKKCPSCYAIMMESTMPAEVPKLQQKSADCTPELSATKLRYECVQCGHMEEEFTKPAPAQSAQKQARI
jgi:hypothetical protein